MNPYDTTMLVRSDSFDTYDCSLCVEELRDYLRAIPPASLVIVAVQDEARTQFGQSDGTQLEKSEAAKDVDTFFASLGATTTDVGFRGSFALVGFTEGVAARTVAGGFDWSPRGSPGVGLTLNVPIPHRIDVDHALISVAEWRDLDPTCKLAAAISVNNAVSVSGAPDGGGSPSHPTVGTGVNGVYEVDGELNGMPKFTKKGAAGVFMKFEVLGDWGSINLAGGQSCWTISANVPGGGSHHRYFVVSDSATPPQNGWQARQGLCSGTVTIGDMVSAAISHEGCFVSYGWNKGNQMVAYVHVHTHAHVHIYIVQDWPLFSFLLLASCRNFFSFFFNPLLF